LLMIRLCIELLIL